MRVTVFGATGRVGALVLRQAALQGHEVVAVARDPSRVVHGVRAERLDLRTADPADLARVVADADAVLSCLGARSRTDVGVAAEGTARILAGMADAGVHRLVAISAAPVAAMRPERPTGDDVMTRLVLGPVLRRVLRATYEDLAAMEALLAASDSDWTAVRPPRLTNGPWTGTFRIRVGANIHDGRSVSRADLADLLLRLPTMQETVRRPVGIAV